MREGFYGIYLCSMCEFWISVVEFEEERRYEKFEKYALMQDTENVTEISNHKRSQKKMFLRNNLIDEVRSSINFGHSKKKKKNATFKKQKKQKYSGISEAIGMRCICSACDACACEECEFLAVSFEIV